MESLAYAVRKNNGFDSIIVAISTMPFLLAGWSHTKKTTNCKHTRYTQSKTIAYIAPPTRASALNTKLNHPEF